jgi:hypothetical protein
MNKKLNLAATSAGIALLLPIAAHAIDQKYARKLEESGCTQASELQGCDINKSKAENARAGFGAAAATGSADHAPAAAISGCNKFADQGYDGTIMSQSALKPGMWEIIIRFEQYRYVCNVSSSGNVSSFDKLD